MVLTRVEGLKERLAFASDMLINTGCQAEQDGVTKEDMESSCPRICLRHALEMVQSCAAHERLLTYNSSAAKHISG